MIKPTSNYLSAILVAALLVTISNSVSASTIFLGFDTQSPVQMYTTGGTFIGNIGQNGATGSAIDGAGHVWTVAPAFGNNVIKEYDSSQTELNSFVSTVNGNWIEDMAWGGGNTIWASSYEGNVFNIDATTGAIISSFSVANTSYAGVAFDGTDLWVTGGLTSNALYKYSTSGTLLATINLANQIGGLGYDSTDNTLWGGGFGSVYHMDLNGNVLGSFVAGSAFHDGLEVGELNTPVPEPSTILLFGAGLAAFTGRRIRRKS